MWKFTKCHPINWSDYNAVYQIRYHRIFRALHYNFYFKYFVLFNNRWIYEPWSSVRSIQILVRCTLNTHSKHSMIFTAIVGFLGINTNSSLGGFFQQFLPWRELALLFTLTQRYSHFSFVWIFISTHSVFISMKLLSKRIKIRNEGETIYNYFPAQSIFIMTWQGISSISNEKNGKFIELSLFILKIVWWCFECIQWKLGRSILRLCRLFIGCCFWTQLGMLKYDCFHSIKLKFNFGDNLLQCSELKKMNSSIKRNCTQVDIDRNCWKFIDSDSNQNIYYDSSITQRIFNILGT